MPRYAVKYPASHWGWDGCNSCWSAWRPFYWNHTAEHCRGDDYFKKLKEKMTAARRKRCRHRRQRQKAQKGQAELLGAAASLLKQAMAVIASLLQSGGRIAVWRSTLRPRQPPLVACLGGRRGPFGVW